ncbi:MAG: GTPase ObgE [Bacillales bacterium]|jgi:GTP-binding protein|nr:GTPase ObgE [Bacillales bacterium]
MFIDYVKVKIKAGDGGHGMISFRREKYVDKGGPSGGDGGKGGNVYFIADSGLNTLLDLTFTRKIVAQNGENGAGKKCYGKNGDDLYFKVPLGTVVTEEKSKKMLANFTISGQKELIAKGGRGGRGNTHFKTSVNQVPKVAENGAKGEEFNVIVELKVLADVGLVGKPSVGKSSFLTNVSQARPEIADYPFTTLNPHLGLVKVNMDESFVIADLPGLIEDAHNGKGLGIKFLKHIERCKVLLHIIDITSPDPFNDFLIINKELGSYNLDLLKRPMVIAINKIDMINLKDATLDKLIAKFDKKYQVFPISTFTNKGISNLINALMNIVKEEKEESLKITIDDTKIFKFDAEEEIGFNIMNDRLGHFIIRGTRVEKLYQMTNISTDEGLLYLTTTLRKMGVETALRKAGVKNGDTVVLCDFEFIYTD